MSNDKAENTQFTNDADEMPTVTTLLRRKKLTVAPDPVAAPVVENKATPPAPPKVPMPTLTLATSVTTVHPTMKEEPARSGLTGAINNYIGQMKQQPVAAVAGGPPLFKSKIVLESLDLKGFGKALSKHKKSIALQKLDTMGFLSKWFSEITLFELSPSGAFTGRIGYGNSNLVVNIKTHSLTPDKAPGIAGIIGAGECFAGTMATLKDEDSRALKSYGFTNLSSVGVFTILYKKQPIGAWICTSKANVTIDAKELKAIKKVFNGLKLA